MPARGRSYRLSCSCCLLCVQSSGVASCPCFSSLLDEPDMLCLPARLACACLLARRSWRCCIHTHIHTQASRSRRVVGVVVQCGKLSCRTAPRSRRHPKHMCIVLYSTTSPANCPALAAAAAATLRFLRPAAPCGAAGGFSLSTGPPQGVPVVLT